MTFKPAHLQSKAHKQLTRQVAATSDRVRKTKIISTALNPELAKREAIRQV